MDPSMMGGQPPMDPSMMGGQSGVTSGDVVTPTSLNPNFAGDPSVLEDPEIMQMAHLEVIIKSPTLRDIVAEYEDTFLSALDHWGRVLFAIYVKAPELKEEVGNLQYRALENSIRNLFKNTGEAILDLHQNTAILSRTLSTSMNSQGQAGE